MEFTLFDSHCHLYGGKYGNTDIETYINKNKKLGMTQIGYDVETNLHVIEMAKKYENCFAAVGVHPSDVENIESGYVEELDKIITDNKKYINALKTGFDFHWDSPPELQEWWFLQITKLARKHNLPIVIHSRDAYDETYKFVKEYAIDLKKVMHCYSYNFEQTSGLTEMGCYISLAGPITFKNGKKQKEVAKNIDINKLLLETDSPYLTPEPYRGKVNYPHYVKYVYDTVSEIRNENIDKIVVQNIKEFYGIE